MELLKPTLSCSIKREHRRQKRHNDACLLPVSTRTVGSTLSTGFKSAGTQPNIEFEVTLLLYSFIFGRFKTDGFTQLPFHRLPTLVEDDLDVLPNTVIAWLLHRRIVPHSQRSFVENMRVCYAK
ncbi:MAG: hypothetical protein F6K37_34000 [Moorea sp. SIO4E2]|uniref:hypothetical protein n=1 Tax=Moorena sp. SIO4E2 TaxID=2607826 RepID=UPI0013BCFCC8|nr:hypothetical protein [Moorena sp. SIO4E2]NEQ10755.1 hypothetical protein [Moorena sp. SIO4E2]